MIASGHQKAQFCCELWFSLVLPYLVRKGKSFTFTQSHFRVLYAIPRLLVVQVIAPFFRARFFSAHVPSADDVTAREYLFGRIANFLDVAERPIICIDANSRYELFHYLDHIQAKASMYVFDAAQQLKTFMSNHSLSAAVCLQPFAQSASGTYTHKDLTKGRGSSRLPW